MAVTKKIEIDGKEVTFKASAAVPRLYRIKFGRDIYKDLRQLEKSVGENDEDNSNLDLFSLEMFEDLASSMTTSFIKPPPSNYLLCSLFGSAVVIKTQQIIRAFFPNLCVKIKEGFIRTRTCETKKSFLVRNLFSCCKGFYSFAHRNYCAAFLLRICRFIVYSIITI